MKLSPKQTRALEIIAEMRYYPTLVKEEDGWYARWRAISEDNDWVDEYVRASAMTRLSEDAENDRHESLHDAWIMALRSRTGLVVWDDGECAAFAAELENWSGTAAEDKAARAETEFEFRPFEITVAIPHGRRALRALGESMFIFPPLGGLKRHGKCLRIELTRTEAESFIRSGAYELRESGYTVKGVDIAVPVTFDADIAETAEGSRKFVARLKVKVAGEEVTAEEIRFLLDQGSSLVFFRDRWIEVNRDILKQALRALSKRDCNVASPVSFAFGIGRIGALDIAEVSTHGWLRGLVAELKSRKAAGVDEETESFGLNLERFNGELRTYQRRGAEWLRFLTEHGFGAMLADDMGLGKTVQTIAWIADRIARGNSGKVLIVAPLTVISNWQHEFAHFAPAVSVYVHQGDKRHLASGFARAVKAADVVITSYNLLVRDYTPISETHWDAMVLDEAQAIKNSATQVARAVRALTPRNRVALTGTPIENTLADVWSIEDFLNPGYLGDAKSFVERFVKPISLNERSAAFAKLRRALEPFVLRRLKSDPEIAPELGDKREIKEYCALSAEQRREYEAALEEFRTSEHRHGDVFALLTRLKLVCDGYWGDEISGGKFERLCDLVENIFDAGESVLIFTQYAKVGAILKPMLEERFARRVGFLHGALSARERDAEIREFNRGGEKAFILSLKAGGFGLNLTKATHVIHYDRWWNPAVENQATDRAHRIGQQKTVFVHQFIAAGTLEEHVDEMLESKQRMAGAVITEMEWLEAARLDG